MDPFLFTDDSQVNGQLKFKTLACMLFYCGFDCF